MRIIDAIIAPPPLRTRFAKIILREFIGASNVSIYAINAPPKFAPKIMIDAARTGSIDWAVNVTNNNTAATLEWIIQANPAPIMNATSKSRLKYSIINCVPGFATTGPVAILNISKETKINDIPIIILPICLLVVCFDLKNIDTPIRSKRGVKNDILIIKI